MKVVSPFGPKIAKLKISNNLINKLNKEVDRILSKKNLIKKYPLKKSFKASKNVIKATIIEKYHHLKKPKIRS